MMNNKQKYGQFYTTNYEYILTGIKIPNNANNFIEPFAGNCDLVKFIENSDAQIDCYDIEPKNNNIIQRDTLLFPPDYKGKYVITNPPYLARNKNSDKTIYDKYNQNDLYKCFIEELIANTCDGGILIIPLNFWCSIRKNDAELRQRFLQVYTINHINIFEERVFDDTSYAICSFQFENNAGSGIDKKIPCTIFPNKNNISITFNENNNFLIGGEIYSLPQNNNFIIARLTSQNINDGYATNLVVKCIDNNMNSKICMKYVDDISQYVDNTNNLSCRAYAALEITPKISKAKEKKLAILFNKFLDAKRKKYNSMFLTNYRESNSIARKRISFQLVFKIVNYLLQK